jgi:aryl-alcohol dehydrogenase-like predicted oxidoreductase
MNFKKLGNTDIKISSICLGTMTWGEQNTQKDAFEQMDYAVDQRINFFDTAEIYPSPCFEKTYASTEKIIGDWFKQKKNRDQIILASKIAGPGLPWVRNGGPQYCEQNIKKAIEDSLKRLKTDYIDLYQLHWPERKTNFFGRLGYNHKEEETLEFKESWNDFEKILITLEKFIKQGKIRYIGLSNETSWGLSKFLEISKLKTLPKMMSVQNPYNLLCRTYEIGLAKISIREKSGLLAYSPLAGGFLTGKYRNNNLPENSRQKLFGDYYTRYSKPNASIVIEKYFNIAKKYNLDFAQMAIKFCEIQKFVTSVIIGATTMEQLKIDIESVNVNLTEEINKKINDVQIIYPNPCP